MPLPPGQQWAARDRWPVIGERAPLVEPGCDAAAWTVRVAGLVARPRQYTLDELWARCDRERSIDLHCVTRWSKPAVRFRGVLLADLLAEVQPTDAARYVSFVARSSRRHDTTLPLADAVELGTMLALECEGEPLAEVHGGPIRVIVPERYLYKSLKWLDVIELLESDRLGFWERTAGYHNRADPWRAERYMAPQLSRDAMRRVLASRDFSGRELRSLDAADADLAGLNAARSILRDADFSRARLVGACFDGANLSNARFLAADLREASFRAADLEGADFAGADLRGADLRGATLTAASFTSPAVGGDAASISEGGAESRSRAQLPPARIDARTRWDDSALEQLMPREREFLEQARGAASGPRRGHSASDG